MPPGGRSPFVKHGSIYNCNKRLSYIVDRKYVIFHVFVIILFDYENDAINSN